MLPIALQCNINVLDFWTMTYGEISDLVDACRENDRLRIREVASFNHSLANLVGLSVARLMDKKSKYPTLKESYPNIFKDLEDNKPVIENAEVTKAKMLKYAESNNKKRGDLLLHSKN
jgi:hypothetical protein